LLARTGHERVYASPEGRDERPWEPPEPGVEGERLKAVGRRQAIEQLEHG
jgi:hypothetical protein